MVLDGFAAYKVHMEKRRQNLHFRDQGGLSVHHESDSLLQTVQFEAQSTQRRRVGFCFHACTE
jgi:hypothetical protein